jgi:hypothetical protein
LPIVAWRIGRVVVARCRVDEARQHAAGDRRAVRVAGDGHGDRLLVGGRRQIALPAADQPHVAFGGGLRRAVAAVDHAVDQDAGRLGQIDRPGQRERRDVLGAPLGVARRQGEVLDDRVAPIGHVHLTVDAAADDLVGPGGADRLAGHRFAGQHLDAGDPGARGASPAAFDGRCIPPLGVARRLNTPGIRAPRAWIGGRLARLGATRHFHHRLLGRRVRRRAGGGEEDEHDAGRQPLS